MISADVPVKIIDVLLYDQGRCRCFTPARSFSALSFRLNSDSRFIYNGKKIPAKTNDVAFVPAGLEYVRESADDEAIVIHFLTYGATGRDILIFSPQNAEKYSESFAGILSEWSGKEVGYKERVTAKFYEILAMLRQDGAKRESEADFVTKTAAIIDVSFGDSTLTVDKLAKDNYISAAYLRKKFSEKFGVSPKRYIENRRIEYAKELLLSGYYSQIEIAERCGYADVKYFRSAFKLLVGQSPMSFIKSNIKGKE